MNGRSSAIVVFCRVKTVLWGHWHLNKLRKYDLMLLVRVFRPLLRIVVCLQARYELVG